MSSDWPGHIIGRLGLPGVLLLVLCISFLGQLLEVLRQDCQVTEKLEMLKHSFPFDDPEEAIHRRWQVWIYLSHMTDVGGAMLLHDLFLVLTKVEISLSDYIWPQPGREASFRCFARVLLGFSMSFVVLQNHAQLRLRITV